MRLPPARSWPGRARALIRLGRPVFLGGGIAFQLLGAALALADGVPPDLRRLLAAQAAVTAVQLMTHYANDYFDLEADRANRTPTRWSGGSRVLPEGLLPPASAAVAAGVLALIALAAIGWLGLAGDRPLAAGLALLALLLAFGYSAPPARLHTRGLGEITAVLVVPVLTPLVGYTAQTGRIAPLPLLACPPLALLQLAMLLAVAFPDAAGDARTGKRTLVVRLGVGSARLYIGAVAAAYGILPVLVAAGLPTLIAAALTGSLPLAAWQIARVGRGDWRIAARQDSLAFGSIALLMLAAVTELLACLALAP